MLGRLKAEGITILVSTPYMDEARRCDRIALMQKGSLLSVDEPDGIIRNFPGELYGVQATNTHRLLTETRAYPGTATCFAFGDALHVTFKDSEGQGASNGAANGLPPYLRSQGVEDARLEKITPGIEDCFIHLLKD